MSQGLEGVTGTHTTSGVHSIPQVNQARQTTRVVINCAGTSASLTSPVQRSGDLMAAGRTSRLGRMPGMRYIAVRDNHWGSH